MRNDLNLVQEFFNGIQAEADIRTTFNRFSQEDRSSLLKQLQDDSVLEDCISETNGVYSLKAEAMELRLQYVGGALPIEIGDVKTVCFLNEDGAKVRIEVTKRADGLYIGDSNVGVNLFKDDVVECNLNTRTVLLNALINKWYMSLSIPELIEMRNFPWILERFNSALIDDYKALYELQYNDGREYGTFLHLLVGSANSDDDVLNFLNYLKSNLAPAEFLDYLKLTNENGLNIYQATQRNAKKPAVEAFLQRELKIPRTSSAGNEVNTHAAYVHASANLVFSRVLKAFEPEAVVVDHKMSGERTEEFNNRINALIADAHRKIRELHEKTDEQLLDYIKPTLLQGEMTLPIESAEIQQKLELLKFQIKTAMNLFNDVTQHGRLNAELRSNGDENYPVPNDEINEGTGLTYKEMLALSYFGIIDERNLDQTTGNTELTRMLRYLQHLFEIRREYNHNENDIDENKCAGGVVNHLIQALVGINKLAEIKFMTLEVQKKLAMQEVNTYLHSHIARLIKLIQSDEIQRTILLQWQLTNIIPFEILGVIKSELETVMFSEIKDRWLAEFGVSLTNKYLGVILGNLQYNNIFKDAVAEDAELNEVVALDVMSLSFEDFKKLYKIIPTFVASRGENYAYIRSAELYIRLSGESPLALFAKLISDNPIESPMIMTPTDKKLMDHFRRLLNKNAEFSQDDLNLISDNQAYALLDWAINNKNTSLVKYVLSKENINPNIQNEREATLLHLALSSGYIEMVQILLTLGNINPNLKNNIGNTPLHYAVMSNNIEAVKLLLAFYGIDTNIRNEDGDTAQTLAARQGNNAIIALFSEHNRSASARSAALASVGPVGFVSAASSSSSSAAAVILAPAAAPVVVAAAMDVVDPDDDRIVGRGVRRPRDQEPDGNPLVPAPEGSPPRQIRRLNPEPEQYHAPGLGARRRLGFSPQQSERQL